MSGDILVLGQAIAANVTGNSERVSMAAWPTQRMDKLCEITSGKRTQREAPRKICLRTIHMVGQRKRRVQLLHVPHQTFVARLDVSALLLDYTRPDSYLTFSFEPGFR